ncbi:hypothetical protein B7C51_20950 [Paenibacillus larvae subsp. pulvifaciens]|uniref:Uncharacterized protein n=2 Tax=Paenibacillus larvae TaxID=1464 RepID=A0A1V0UXF4_9BACL|nr:hypothetical protein [Paenibacillus larvae]ARF69779.1 hypothetical protein B7C51_20950 [Paenibacillus larvae subsp. pulvifaciens]QHZ52475.1 hypothetical protein ERICV_03364 [Paenibacillus larvae subsp. larvae]
MNAYSKWLAVLLVLLLLFIYPLLETFEREEDMSYLISWNAVIRFVDAARNKGGITPAMYNDFVDTLRATGNEYEITMIHEHKRYDPVYLDPLNPDTFQGNYAVHYEAYYQQQIMKILFPDTSQTIEDPGRHYKMAEGDFFHVQIHQINQTPYEVLSEALNNGGSRVKLTIPYGGIVRNEDE